MTDRGPVATALATGGASWEPDLLAALSRHSELVILRRCVDVADLLAAADTGTIRAAVVASSLDRLDRDVIGALRRGRVVVVGLLDADSSDEATRPWMEAIGVETVLPTHASAADVAAAVAATVGAAESAPSDSTIHREASAEAGPREPGRLVAVWGPIGSPGRTTLALNLATELARAGVVTLLADADSYGASLAQALGLLDEAPGLAAAVRAASQGRLDTAALARHARQVEARLQVLTGLPRADRWPELRPAGLEHVWTTARASTTMTVIDCGFALEQSDDIGFDVGAPRRNAATLVSLEQADVVIAVGNADPIGLQRLIRGLSDLGEAVPGGDIRVVVNRVRRGVSGGEGRRGAAALLRRHAGVESVWTIPDNSDALDAALMAGRPLADVAPRSPARLAIRELALELIGSGSTVRRGARHRHRSPISSSRA